jgi:hypothetical protein
VDSKIADLQASRPLMRKDALLQEPIKDDGYNGPSIETLVGYPDARK